MEFASNDHKPLATSSPAVDHRQQIDDIGGAVVVGVAGADGVTGDAVTPVGDDFKQVKDVHFTISASRHKISEEAGRHIA